VINWKVYADFWYSTVAFQSITHPLTIVFFCLLERKIRSNHGTAPSQSTVSPAHWKPVAFSPLCRGDPWDLDGCDESGAPATLEVSWAAENSRFLSSYRDSRFHARQPAVGTWICVYSVGLFVLLAVCGVNLCLSSIGMALLMNQVSRWRAHLLQ
jgi:hypothetical protein